MGHLAKALFMLFWLGGCYGPLLAAERAYAPAPGTALRREISDALRSVVEKELNKPVVFRIEVLKVKQAWAFLRGVPLDKSGKRMDYHGTPYQASIEDGQFDDGICSLLRKEAKGNRWKVVTYSLGATDAPFVNWAERYHAPAEIIQ